MNVEDRVEELVYEYSLITDRDILAILMAGRIAELEDNFERLGEENSELLSALGW